MKRFVKCLLGVATLGVGSLAFASTAAAATSATWGGGSWTSTVGTDAAIESATFTVSNNGADPIRLYSSNLKDSGGLDCTTLVGPNCVVTAGQQNVQFQWQAAAATAAVYKNPGSGYADSGYTLSFTGSIGGDSSSSGSGPTPVVQAFGKPATGTCEQAASNDLNWAGVSSGG